LHRSVPARLILPFVNTPPLIDLLMLIALLPLWWALGVDQLIWLAAAPYVALRLLIGQRGRVRLPMPLRWLALFIGVQFVSLFFIAEAERYITFVRTTGAYIAAWCVALVIVNTVDTARKVRLVIGVLVGTLIVVALLGLLGIVGVWRPQFTAPIALLIPDSLENTDYGANLVVRKLGGESWFTLLGSYYRLAGTFFYPTTYAAALLMIIPLALLSFWTARSLLSWGLLGAALLLFAVNLLYTTGRLAMVGVVAGGAYFVLFASRWRTLSRMTAVALLALVIGALLVWMWQEGELPGAIIEPLDELVFARGAGSVNDRGNIYAETLTSALERPLFGWGTERDLPTLGDFPAGSHSYYLGVLYKYGGVGLLIFACMGASIWHSTRPPRTRSATGDARSLVRLLWYGRWLLIGLVVNAVTEIFDLDTSVLMLTWTIIALLICARWIVERRSDSPAFAPALPAVRAADYPL
jgi:hypothetical protein